MIEALVRRLARVRDRFDPQRQAVARPRQEVLRRDRLNSNDEVTTLALAYPVDGPGEMVPEIGFRRYIGKEEVPYVGDLRRRACIQNAERLTGVLLNAAELPRWQARM